MNRWRLFIMVLWLLPMGVYCQVDSSSVSQPSSPTSFLRHRRETYDNFEQEAKRKYRSIQDSVNQLYAQELAKEWKRYELQEGYRLERDKDSIDAPADTFRNAHPDEGSVQEPSEKYEMGSIFTPSSQQLHLMHSTNVVFLATRYNCFIPKSYLNLRLNGVKDISVSQFWNQLNCVGMEWFAEQCGQYQNRLHLNDWGVFDFVRKMFSQQFPDQYNAQTIMTVFVLNQLGIRAKVGRMNQQLLCLLAIDATVYGGVPFHKEKGFCYYAFSLDPSVRPKGGSPIEVVEADFGLAERQADMRIQEPMQIAVDTTYWRGFIDGDSLIIPYNRNVTNFYRDYPCVDLQVYLNASHDPVWEESIGRRLQSLLAKIPIQVEKVGYLMKLIRSNFKYASDYNQFDYDKFFFCEENFFYGANDCEDRSVLLAYFVRNFVGLDVVLLAYPKHVVMAVNFTENVREDSRYVLHNGKKYVICDPSYIGRVGDLADKYLNWKPEIIEMK